MKEDIKKVIFIITAPNAGPSDFIAYLKANKWTVKTTSDISTALPFIFNNPLHCVMISADHPHPNCSKIPQTISHAVNTPAIMFSEGLSSFGAENLKVSKHPYTLSAPIKGPDIEKMIAKIGQAQDSISKNFKKKSPEDLIHISKLLTESPAPDQLLETEPIPTLTVGQVKAILSKAADQTIAKVSMRNLEITNPVHKIIQWTPSHFFQIESKNFSGCLVVAFGLKFKNDKDFAAKLKSQFAESMQSQGHPIKILELKKVNLEPVDFEEFAGKQGTFFKKSDHPESEVSISFFPLPEASSNLETSKDLEMFKIALTEISLHFPLEFDLYIYLPLNKKYIRNVSKDQLLAPKQLTKLLDSGITEAYVRRDSEKDLIKLRLQNLMNSLIKSFPKK